MQKRYAVDFNSSDALRARGNSIKLGPCESLTIDARRRHAIGPTGMELRGTRAAGAGITRRRMLIGARSAAPALASSAVLPAPTPNGGQVPTTTGHFANRAGSPTPAVDNRRAGPITALATSSPGAPTATVQPAGFPEPLTGVPLTAGDDRMFAPQSELTAEGVVTQVLARNPSIEAMASAWRASAERYPQVSSLEDPTFMSMIAPGSIGSNTVQTGFVVGGAQKIPWHGKRAARGQIAQAEATAAFEDVQLTRLQVAEAARLAFYEYYLVERELELNADTQKTVQQYLKTARSRFESNLVGQEDVLQADIALADVRRRHLELQRMERTTIARINTLLVRPPEAPLPPPPASLVAGPAPATADALRTLAVERRPDLAGMVARIRAEEAAVNLAAKDFYPDTEVYGRYDSFWQPAATQSPLRAQVGVNMNVPLYRKKRHAALREAEFRLSQRRAEYQQRLNDIHYEVQAAYEQMEQARQTALLYEEKFLPVAEQNVTVARTNYDVGRINFLGLIQAQQQLLMAREKSQEATVDYYRRSAELQRAVGGELPQPAAP